MSANGAVDDERWFDPDLPLVGMRLKGWLALLWESRLDVSPSGQGSLFSMSVQALINELIAWNERAFLERAEPFAVKPKQPIMVLGFFRSGTTHLQRLLAQDPKLATPTMLQTHNPHTFLTLEGHLGGRYASLGRKLYQFWHQRVWRVPPSNSTRVVDNMSTGLEHPCDDEYAMVMGGQSSSMGCRFGSIGGRYRAYLTLKELETQRKERWARDWLVFLKKLTFRYEGRPLILKSPQHTARVSTILEIFPEAKFLHIHRHPFELFPSFVRLARMMVGVPLEGEPQTHELEMFLFLYDLVYSAFLEDRERLRDGQYCEVKYNDVAGQPVQVLERVYRHLGLGDFSHHRQRLSAYVDGLKSYKKNDFPPLKAAHAQRIHSTLERYFHYFGYSP